jgi:hypothetical protein
MSKKKESVVPALGALALIAVVGGVGYYLYKRKKLSSISGRLGAAQQAVSESGGRCPKGSYFHVYLQKCVLRHARVSLSASRSASK